MMKRIKDMVGQKQDFPPVLPTSGDTIPERMGNLPSELENRVLIADNIVHISSEVPSDNPALLSFLSYSRRQGFKQTARLALKTFSAC